MTKVLSEPYAVASDEPWCQHLGQHLCTEHWVFPTTKVITFEQIDLAQVAAVLQKSLSAP
eukprot:1160784-Pelagomonas_calceolata.AAC.10